MTKREIIIETKEFYAADPSRRGVVKRNSETTGYCVYYNPENQNKCAVGRCLTNKGLEIFKNIRGPVGLTYLGDRQEYLKDEYRGHEQSFWQNLQRFHDFAKHWNEKGLTEEGEKYYNEIFEKYKD